MTVSFQVHNTEELNLITSMLLQLKQSGVSIQVVQPDVPVKHQVEKYAGITERLYGIVKLPANFDYKSFIANELLTKHG